MSPVKIIEVFSTREKRRFGFLFLCILLMGFLEVVGIASILPFMELLSKPDAIEQSIWLKWAYETYGFKTPQDLLLTTGFLVIGLLAVANSFSAFTTWLQYKYSWDAAQDLSMQLLRTYLVKPYSYFLVKNSSELLTYLIAEVANFISGLIIPAIEFVSKLVVAMVILALLIRINPGIALVLIITLGGAYGIIFASRQKLLKRLGNKRINTNAARYKNLVELLSGIKTIRMYRAQSFFYRRYEEASRQFCDIQPRVNFAMAAPKYFLEIFAFGGILAIALYLYITKGGIQSSLPRLSLYAIAGYRLMPALQDAFSAISKIRHNLPIIERLYADLRKKVDPKIILGEAKELLAFNHSIQFENLDFYYENAANPALKNIDITIKKGEVVAFVGATGSGKTSLIDILVGLLPPTKGTLKVDGVEVNEENVESWQGHISYVPQEVFLFDDSVARNISLQEQGFLSDLTPMYRSAQMADIHDFITKELPLGYQTEIGENGVRLSGGQRQRLGLARALYKSPTLLVLDEATSALDQLTEKSVMESIENLPEDLTVVLIAHRLSTVRRANRIYVMEEGSIVSEGSYDDLIENSEKFRIMAQLS